MFQHKQVRILAALALMGVLAMMPRDAMAWGPYWGGGFRFPTALYEWIKLPAKKAPGDIGGRALRVRTGDAAIRRAATLDQ